MKRKTPRVDTGRRLAVAIGFVAACIGAQAPAASFPDYPLQTGTGSIPPNIMFILDDSGSMAWLAMPANLTTLNDRVEHRSYVHNTIYYDPRIDYRPWMQANGVRMTGGTTHSSAFSNLNLATGAVNLASLGDQTYYVPKSGVVFPGTDNANYDKYIIRTSGAVERCEWVVANSSWENCSAATPTGRSAEAERNNYATWFSYHRTRMKAAKAGASEAFAGLGENFRVGYDSIWNRRGSSTVGGGLPALQIPVSQNNGLFAGANRTLWFDHLFEAEGSSTTPLHGALQRTGRYYETQTGASGPWGPQTGDAQLSCRQNYAILTTDGYWNSNSGYTAIGNADGTAGEEITSADGERSYTYQPARPYSDTFDDTLADVAMHYWKRDLRDDLANNVPSSASNPAFWQNMSTFGISIGLQGTLSPDDVILIEGNEKSWPNPWRTNGNSSDSWSNESARRIDDLLHAAVNGRGSFVAAANPQEFAEALQDSLAAIARRRSSGSNVASNGPSLNNGSHLFQATYTSGEWSGDVVGISIVGGSIAGTPSWSMAAVANDDPVAFREREVYTWNSSGTDFPTSAQRTALARNVGLPGEVTGTQNANYIKGYRTGEGTSQTALRRRTSPIGDIVNSSPFYVPETNMLYIGANDGMLHAIDASNGSTRFSYVPAGLNFSNLALLSSQDYSHRFFVDGGVDVTTRAQGGDRNILVASLGRGGKGVFALDVTETGADDLDSDIVLWDKTSQGSIEGGDMGHVLGAPLVRQGNTNIPLAIVGNGIDSPNGSAALFIYNALTGALIKKIVVDSSGGNGLAEPRAADVTGDGKADYVYAGDLKGNLWKFDISDSNTNKWEVAHKSGNTIHPLFRARDASNNPQPITAAVALARHPGNGRIFVLFGTGSYITNGDMGSTATQSVYALMDEDSGTYPITKGELHQRTIPLTGVDSLGRAARSWEPYAELDAGKRGWFVNLGVPTAGERVVTAPFVRARALWFSSIIPLPGEGCDSGGTGYLNAVDAFTGTNPRAPAGGGTYTFIDVDGDGQGNDRLAGSGTGDSGFITSVDLGIGMPSQGIGVGNAIYVCGSDAECGRAPTPPPGSGPARLRWRELVDQE